jgi:hypothetical protein
VQLAIDGAGQTFNIGIIVERLGGIETGHRELLDWIERWIFR